MTDFNSLKKSNSAKDLSRLTGELEKLNTKPVGGGKDDREWKLTVDKAGNGSAVIRFLSPPKGEDVPWARMFDHGFQGPGGWYIENSLTTIGLQDPVSEYNSTLWNTGTDENKDIVRKQKRRLGYWTNIFVIKDAANPANEGKVFLYKFGKKIFDKINDAMNPEFEDETAFNPFDFWQGADFKLRARKVEGYRNYDKSEFAECAPLKDSDDELEAIYASQYSLAEKIAPSNFKTYDELKARMVRVLGLSQTQMGSTVPTEQAAAPSAPARQAPSLPSAEAAATASDDSEDLAFFANLADE